MGQSRSTLFLIEKLIVIAVFAICASACAGIFVESYIMANDARDTNYALAAAKNGAERYKTFENLSDTTSSLGGGLVYGTNGDSAVVYYDKDWQLSSESDAAYAMRFKLIGGDTLPKLCQLSVERMNGDGDNLVEFTVAARGK